MSPNFWYISASFVSRYFLVSLVIFFMLNWLSRLCSDSKESACNVGDLGSIPGLGRSPGEGNGYPLQYSCLENSVDRGAWWAAVLRTQRVRHDWATNFHFFFSVYFHICVNFPVFLLLLKSNFILLQVRENTCIKSVFLKSNETICGLTNGLSWVCPCTLRKNIYFLVVGLSRVLDRVFLKR